jgi:glycyl-tRNA synthetase beta chain
VTRDLVVEIGVEEVPASYLPPAVQQLREEFGAFLGEAGLGAESIETDATPRRLVLLAKGIPVRQEDRTTDVTGPPWKAAFAPDGSPTKAAEGFAKGRGLDVSALRRIETERGPYAGATVVVAGRPTIELLAEALPSITKRLAFPKTMRWGPERVRFPRPVRWILALFGEDVVPFEIEGVRSGRTTHGHRILAPGPFEVRSPADYERALTAGRVVLRAADRARAIEAALESAASRAGGTLVRDPELVGEVSYLVETPSVFESAFDEEFLRLPAPVIVTSMRDHQRYFAVRSADGKLLPRFLCVANSAPESVNQVRDGNQRVLRARLDDARFYWNEDLKTTLEQKVPKLASVVWLEGFGSLLDKTNRVRALAERILGSLTPPADTAKPVVSRAAFLAKADLVTEMIRDGKQFASLQGVIGREYALQNGEPDEVAEAIRDQYLPQSAGDQLPRTEAGAVLGVADRLDTLVGVWASGQKPTGSKDPFALRRGAVGILRIMLDRRWENSFREWIAWAAEQYGSKVENRAETIREVGTFVDDRLGGIFVESGAEPDVVAAVLSAQWHFPLEAQERVEAFSRVRVSRRAEFEALAAGYKRAKNILKEDSAEGKPSLELLTAPAEKELYDAYVRVDEAVASAAAQYRFDDAIAALAELRAPIDSFFDSVRVLVEEDAVRANRLRLLGRIVDRVQGLADLSRLAVSESRSE